MANFNLNKVILGGRMVADPELKQTQSGVHVCSFRIAVNRRGENGGADFFECQAWRATAEFVSRFFRKGSSICVIGNVKNTSWTDQNGQKRTKTEVIAEEVTFVDSKEDAQNTFAQGADALSGAYMPDAYQEPSESKFELVGEDDNLPF